MEDENKVEIETKEWADGLWSVRATITTAVGVRSGPHQIEGPDSMTDEELQAAVLALYVPPGE